MKKSLELKEFQWDTVGALVQRFESGTNIYALADEVGLGKTFICAETAYQCLGAKKFSGQKIIFYLAPSIELLHQNLEALARYLHQRVPDRVDIPRPQISRLTKLPLDLLSMEQKTEGRNCIKLIGLSPGTSFNLRSGAGTISERAFLAALFGYGREARNKKHINDFFWFLKRRPERNEWYFQKCEEWSAQRSLGDLLDIRETEEFEILLSKLLEFKISKTPSPEQKGLITEVRKTISNFIIRKMVAEFVIFDEWHKYKHVCFKNEVLKSFLNSVRCSNRTKTLLVSATPFAVNFETEGQSDSDHVESEDLRGMLEMIWGQEESREHYSKLAHAQQSFVSNVSRFLKHGDIKLKEVDESKALYQKELRKYCVRTERPKTDLDPLDISVRTFKGWQSLSNDGSIDDFLTKFKSADGIRSPITSMWMDGHTFPEFEYQGFHKIKINRIKGLHWKTNALKAKLERDFKFDDELHSYRRPPLWLAPAHLTKNRKHIVFTEYKFVPEEICSELSSRFHGFGYVKRDSSSGSRLGYFPLGHSERRSRKSVDQGKESIHFAIFYPFLVFERTDWRSALEEKIDNIRRRILSANEETNAVDLVLELDALFDGEGERICARQKLLDSDSFIPTTDKLQEYLQWVLDPNRKVKSPGEVLSEAINLSGMTQVRTDHLDELSDRDRKNSIEAFERETLRVSSSLLRLFASSEARGLLKALRQKMKLGKLVATWGVYVQFAIWYSNKFDLSGTFRDFLTLLLNNGISPQISMQEVADAISLRKGGGGNRFIRSFHDRKVHDSEGRGEEVVSQKSIRSAFNSPFPPYVLASTSIGQEGLDLHRYCTSVVHWNPPGSPAILRQREGRVDRFMSMQNRLALAGLEGELETEANLRGFSPDFVVYKNGRRINKVDRTVWFLPSTSQEAQWLKCLKRMYYVDLLIGAPDPLTSERVLLSQAKDLSPEEWRLRFSQLKDFSVSLRPKPLSPVALKNIKG